MCPSGTEDGFYDGLACGNTSPHTAGRDPSPSGKHGGEGEESVRKSCQVVIAAGSHLFPFRTEKLSPPAPMVLQCNAGE